MSRKFQISQYILSFKCFNQKICSACFLSSSLCFSRKLNIEVVAMILIISLIFLSVSFSYSSPLTRDDRIVFRDSDEQLSYGISRLGVYETKQDNQREIQDDPEADIGLEFSQGLFQGDIVLTEDQQKYFNSSQEQDDDEPFRTGLIDKRYRWLKDSEGKVIVPFIIATDSEYCEFFLKNNSFF
jgi:hypothetical protein